MFIVPCKYHSKCLIEESVKSIRLLYPTTKILVVDSNSDDKNYFDRLKSYNVIIADIANVNYECGALWYAVDKYMEDWYVLLQDSVILNKSIDEQLNSDKLFYTFINFSEGSKSNHMNASPEKFINRINDFLGNFEKLPLNENVHYTGVFGPNFIIKRKLIDEMLLNQLDKFLLPTNKFDHQIAERVFGIVVEKCGINIAENTLIGNLHQLMFKCFDASTETLKTDYINKTWLNKHRE